MDDEVLVMVRASPMRRAFGLAALLGLAGIVLYVAIATPPALGWQVFLVVLGAGVLWMTERTRRATATAIELTREVLRSTNGDVIASLDNIAGIDRSTFAFKPSNGFLLTLKTPGARRWEPGIYWAFGRRVGVGGVLPGPQTKFLAQTLETLLLERAQA
ncbi:hypothetical protein SAMN04490248_104112 [Salinihabitans flavidus]|uniref:Uncharacterized protein n=2 Tax=Salinihabitans flavidus TaxID=569882 RepID=A0A1H8P355_9RHOB|nr:hypothetical protein SAMN04490248_104112 [Salinihabitans flavidus]